MEMLTIDGELPVAMTVLDGQKPLKLKKMVMQQLTVGQSIKSQATLRADQFIVVGELAAMTQLIDEHGKLYPLSYDALESSSRQNFDYLAGLRGELDAKEQAESLS
jgi:hypothetical protein